MEREVIDYNAFMPFGGSDVRFEELDRAKVVVLPLYYEVSPSYGSGSKDGAYHILRASAELECMDEELMLKWCDAGIHTLPAFVPDADPDKAIFQIREQAGQYMDSDKFLLSLGGDHAVTIGLVAAAMEKFEGDAQGAGRLGVLQIDAHLDLRDYYNGSSNNHACVMRRISDMNVPFVQVGIRSVSPEEGDYLLKRHLRPFFAHNIDPADNGWMDAVVDQLPENVYLTLDLDGLDPSVVPGTGTPEPGGLSYRQVVALIRKVASRRNIVGADINELAKIEGTQVSEFVAARLAAKILVYCCMM